jgi:sugar lactone lactonase YvrE
MRLSFLLSLVPSALLFAQGGYEIHTVAGIGFPEGAAATSLSVGAISGLTVDPFGTLYLSSSTTFSVMRVGTDGRISTYAQSPIGAAWDELLYPAGLALDPVGNLYVASTDNNYIKRIDPTGLMTNFAGNGTRLASGGAIAVSQPSAVAVGPSGAVYANDAFSGGIVRIDTDHVLSYLLRGGNPSAVVTDQAENLYIADTQLNQVRRYGPSGHIEVVAGTGLAGYSGDGGLASQAQLRAPNHLTLSPSGDLYIADGGNTRIRRVDPSGNISSVNTNSLHCYNDSASACFGPDASVAVDQYGNLYIGSGYQVLKLDTTGQLTVVAGNNFESFSGDGGLATSAQLNLPVGLQFDPQGNLLIADLYNGEVRIVDHNGTILPVVKPVVDALTGLSLPMWVASTAFDGNGHLLVVDMFLQQVLRVESDGTLTPIAGTGRNGPLGDNGPAASALLRQPRSILLDPAGNLLISEAGGNRIRKIDTSGIITTIVGTGSAGFSGDGGPGVSAQLRSPQQIALDGAGNLYVADTLNHRIRKIDSTGTITTVAGSGSLGFEGDGGLATEAQLSGPTGVSVDSAGVMYIADRGNNRIRRVSADGVISTIAGGGRLLQDGVPAETAFIAPEYLLLEPVSGDIYFSNRNLVSALRRSPEGDLKSSARHP